MAMARRMSSVAVRQMPSSIGSVADSRKKSARVQHEAALGLDRAAAQHLHALGLARQADQLVGGDDVELDQQIRKARVGRRLVDDDAHRAILGMGADIDDAAAEARCRSCRASRSGIARRDSCGR